MNEPTPVCRLARLLLDCRDPRCGSLCVTCLTAIRQALGLRVHGFDDQPIETAGHVPQVGRKADRLRQEAASRHRDEEHLAELDAVLRESDPAYTGWLATTTPQAPKGNHKARRMNR